MSTGLPPVKYIYFGNVKLCKIMGYRYSKNRECSAREDEDVGEECDDSKSDPTVTSIRGREVEERGGVRGRRGKRRKGKRERGQEWIHNNNKNDINSISPFSHRVGVRVRSV